METKTQTTGHTPGPWTVSNVGGIHANAGHNYAVVVAITKHCDPLTDVQSMANARLIAAAPEMLDALRQLVAAQAERKIVRDRMLGNDAQAKANRMENAAEKVMRQAIAKATGGAA